MFLKELARVAIANGESRVKVNSTINPILRTYFRGRAREIGTRLGITGRLSSSWTSKTREKFHLELDAWEKGPGLTIEDFLEEYPEERWTEQFPSLPYWGPGRQQYFKYLLEKYYVVNTESDHEDYYGDDYHIDYDIVGHPI